MSNIVSHPAAASRSKRRRRRGPDDPIRTSVYLPVEVYEAIRTIAFQERRKKHDIVMEGIGLALSSRGYSLESFKLGKRERKLANATGE